MLWLTVGDNKETRDQTDDGRKKEAKKPEVSRASMREVLWGFADGFAISKRDDRYLAVRYLTVERVDSGGPPRVRA